MARCGKRSRKSNDGQRMICSEKIGRGRFGLTEGWYAETWPDHALLYPPGQRVRAPFPQQRSGIKPNGHATYSKAAPLSTHKTIQYIRNHSPFHACSGKFADMSVS